MEVYTTSHSCHGPHSYVWAQICPCLLSLACTIGTCSYPLQLSTRVMLA